MYSWSKHKDHHVRRLASEGSRSRLPWAIALPQFKKDPSPLLPILNNLKNDSSEYVRRSVANSLNDISKDNPKIIIEIAKDWKDLSNETNYIIKHASRTLLKQGNTEILKHFGLHVHESLICSNFNIQNERIYIGENLEFSFELLNNGTDKQLVRLEYGIHYLRSNGTHSKKVFKISERVMLPNEKFNINRKQSFRIITTKKFYAGIQHVSIIINGQEKLIKSFELLNE
jgi:3-methyladenine DNA glycosylase AlkC